MQEILQQSSNNSNGINPVIRTNFLAVLPGRLHQRYLKLFQISSLSEHNRFGQFIFGRAKVEKEFNIEEEEIPLYRSGSISNNSNGWFNSW